MDTTNQTASVQGREEFYHRAGAQNLSPLWVHLSRMVTPEPVTPVVPAMWHYDEIRPYLMEACKIITTEEAERRVLMLENPGLPGQQRITHSLFGGLQIILPGEVAPAHRHAAAALRFIIEGHNAYTSVGGERTMMSPGDFVITPSMAWHDHGNLGDGPMVWLDVLDLHLVNIMDASFLDHYPERMHPVTRPDGAADAEVAYNLVPDDFEYKSKTTPIFNYPYTRTREALERLRKFRAPDPYHAFRMRYTNPVDGGWAMPTISTWMQLLPKGFTTRPYRSTDSTGFVVVEGEGKSTIGGKTYSWGPRDIFVAPSWQFHEQTASSDAVIFQFSDRVVQEKLDFWREHRGNA
jgi:gentisate 1,2-dioxygenase